MLTPRRLLSAIELIAGSFLLLIALLTTANVVLRDVFAIQIPDWFDGAKALLGIALFWGVALTTWRGSHICVDIVWEHLKPRGQRLLDWVATAVVAGFLGPLAWMTWVKVSTMGTQTTMDLRIPLAGVYALAAVGATAAAVLALARLLALSRGRAPEADPDPAPRV